MRAADRSFGGLLLIEALDEAAPRNATARLGKLTAVFAEVIANLSLYTMFFGLHNCLLAART